MYWRARALVESTLTSQVILPAPSAKACNAVNTVGPVPISLLCRP